MNDKHTTTGKSPERGVEATYSVAIGTMPGSPDQLDKDVYSATHYVRRLYEESCSRLGIPMRNLSPIQIGMRSVR
jgi:hypothetical protein